MRTRTAWKNHREAAGAAKAVRCTAVYFSLVMLAAALSPTARAQRRATPQWLVLALTRDAPLVKLLYLLRRAVEARNGTNDVLGTMMAHQRGGACVASNPLAAARWRLGPLLSPTRGHAAIRDSGNGNYVIRCMTGQVQAHRDHPPTTLIVPPLPIAMGKCLLLD